MTVRMVDGVDVLVMMVVVVLLVYYIYYSPCDIISYRSIRRYLNPIYEHHVVSAWLIMYKARHHWCYNAYHDPSH